MKRQVGLYIVEINNPFVVKEPVKETIIKPESIKITLPNGYSISSVSIDEASSFKSDTGEWKIYKPFIGNELPADYTNRKIILSRLAVLRKRIDYLIEQEQIEQFKEELKNA